MSINKNLRATQPEQTAPPRKKWLYAVYITICATPAVLTALFYVLRGRTDIMDRAGENLTRPIRSFLGLMSSVYPFSAAEVLCTLAAAWAIYHIVKTIAMTVRARDEKLKRLGIRALALAAMVLWVWCGFCWLWGSAYYETGFAEKNGFTALGVTTEDLSRTAAYFLDKANALAPLVKRDADGHFSVERAEYLASYGDIYKNLTFKDLDGAAYRPKMMLYSWLMSRTGFTGLYFAFTGEANINKNAPGCLIPATVAHELAHQRGIAAEEEANFAAVAACISSGNTVYEYSGSLMGLIHLMNALNFADYEAWSDIRSSFCPELERDWNDNIEYWQAQRTVETGTGIEFLDNTLTAMVETAEEAVTAFYDGYLKSYGQELGIRSYGACVDLLVEWIMYWGG